MARHDVIYHYAGMKALQPCLARSRRQVWLIGAPPAGCFRRDARRILEKL
ncbi:hypothetical protein [Akkermansia sp.]|nr:hypothetical protein [Akkermansia sp.]